MKNEFLQANKLSSWFSKLKSSKINLASFSFYYYDCTKDVSLNGQLTFILIFKTRSLLIFKMIYWKNHLTIIKLEDTSGFITISKNRISAFNQE